MSGESAETTLLPLAIAGDREALSRLLLHHYVDLQRFVEQRLAGEAVETVAAEDILQQVFVRAAVAITSFEPREANSLRGWLMTIAANLVRDVHKRRRRERRADRVRDDALSEGADQRPDGPRGLDQLATDSTSPSMRVHRRDSLRRLREALATLPADQEEVIRRYYLQHESLDQIATAMSRSKDTVRGICFRARQNLRSQMGNSSLFFTG